MIAEHDRLVLTTDLPDDYLASGDVGTVVHVYADEAAYEVEFFTLDGHTAAVVTIDAAHVRPVSRGEILHARPLVALRRGTGARPGRDAGCYNDGGDDRL